MAPSPSPRPALEPDPPGRRRPSGAAAAPAPTPGSPAGGLLRLQRLAGNRAVASVQRDPLVLDPVVLSNDPREQARQQAQSDAMAARFPEVVRGFCRDWHLAAVGALASAPEPEDPYARQNFAVALGGNVAWALTGLTLFATAVPPLAAGAALTVSIYGAFAGSGGFAEAAPPSGREEIAGRLAARRDEMEQGISRERINDVIIECLGDPRVGGDRRLQDRLLWARLFGAGIPYDTRTAVLTRTIQATVARWLAAFQAQYLAWKEREDVRAAARRYDLARQVNEPYGDPFRIVMDELGVGTPADVYFQCAMADIPFVFRPPG